MSVIEIVGVIVGVALAFWFVFETICSVAFLVIFRVPSPGPNSRWPDMVRLRTEVVAATLGDESQSLSVRRRKVASWLAHKYRLA